MVLGIGKQRMENAPVFLLLHHVFMCHIIAIHQWLCRVQGGGGGDPTHPRPGVSEYLASRPVPAPAQGRKLPPASRAQHSAQCA